MKRHFVIACILLFMILSGSVLNARAMSRLTEALTAQTEAVLAADAAGNADEARQLAGLLTAQWEQAQQYLESVLVHGELCDITLSISDFESAAAEGHSDDLRSAGRRLCAQFRHLASLERFRLGNIL